MKVKGLHLEDKTPQEQRKIRLLSDIAFAYLHQLDIHAKKHLVNYKKPEQPAIYALWHGYQWTLGMFPQEDRLPIHILISLSNDGEMISRVCHLMGFSLVRGSQGRNGDRATRDILTEINNGNSIAFMVDGPLGPKQKVKKGIIKLAKMAKVPIIPVGSYTKDKFCINSWDNYQIPYNLWAKATMVFGNSIYVPEDINEETEKELRLKLENAMFDAEKDAIIEYRNYWGNKNG